MKLELDYENKIVSVQGAANLSGIVAKLQLAVDDWKEWEIQCNSITYVTYPSYPTYPIDPLRPVWTTPITYISG
jgi:hypothetical protein